MAIESGGKVKIIDLQPTRKHRGPLSLSQTRMCLQDTFHKTRKGAEGGNLGSDLSAVIESHRRKCVFCIKSFFLLVKTTNDVVRRRDIADENGFSV